MGVVAGHIWIVLKERANACDTDCLICLATRKMIVTHQNSFDESDIIHLVYIHRTQTPFLHDFCYHIMPLSLRCMQRTDNFLFQHTNIDGIL